MRCALVIPTRNAGAHLDRLLPALVAQRRQPDSILVVDSRSSDDTVERFRAFGARVEIIEPASFNHGGTRRWASQQVEADALIYLTQDAIPASPDSFANLLDELYAEADIGVAYGRQLPHPGAGLLGAQARRFNYPPESRSKRLADASELGIKTCFSSDSFSAYRSDALAAVGVIEETTAVERLAKDLEKKFEVTHAAGSTVMEISFTWSEPEVAQEVVKAWIEIYMEERTQALGRKSLYAFYEAQTADSAAQIKSYKAQILKHLNEIGASSIEDRLQDLSERINVLRGERFNSIRLIASSDSALESTRQQLKGLPREIVTVRQIALNPAQQDLRRLLNQKRLERADMMRTYTDDAPPVKALDASIRALEKEVQDEGATVQSSEDRAPNTLTTHLERVLLDETSNNAALRTQLAEQEKQLAELEAQRREALDIEPTLARLQRELNATERNYALYVDSLEKSRIDRELDKSQISNISVIEEATYNPGRIFPKTLLMLFLAVPFGLAVGLLVVYLCYLLDQRIHDGGLVEEKFGLPLWTTLPELSNSTAESSNAFTASIYRLYGLLPYARIEEKGLTLGLTSARHGEGVTFIIEQLRRLLEENGVRVRIGGEPAQPGEVVLLDAPALLDSREAFIALRRADLIALVVEAQKSTVPVVEHALTILTTAFGKVDGIIINRRRFEVPSKVLQTIARYRSAF